jgi:hypothetical protein
MMAMSRYYNDPIEVALLADGTPAHIVWRGTRYRVRRIFARWHLRDRWWATAPSTPEAAASEQPSDRYYYRLYCAPSLICDIYEDAEGSGWRLEYLHD